MTAAAEGPVTFGYFFYRWKARLCGWRGSSSAQGIGRRVRTPAPMAYSEALSFFRRGALCAPAGGLWPHTSSVTLRVTPSPKGGRLLKSHPSAFPFRGRCPRRGRMRYPCFETGALARQRQARLWNRTGLNFPHSQGPVARRELKPATQILRAGNVLPTSRGNLRIRGPGKAVLWT